MTKTLVGTVDPNREPCPICHELNCTFHTEDERIDYKIRKEVVKQRERFSECPDNNPELIPDIEIDLPEVPIASIKEMIAWFPKDKYVLEEDDNGYIIYYDSTRMF